MKKSFLEVPPNKKEFFMKVLHIVVHPNMTGSRVNKSWREILEKDPSVTTSYSLYEKYPNFDIDVKEEQKQLVEHDKIVFQFPIMWYSVPPLLKKWFDDVLAFNFAYGEKGKALVGKEFQVITSTGGNEESYGKEGYNHFTIEEFFRHLEQTAGLCGMKFLPPFVMYDSFGMSVKQIEEKGKEWAEKLS